jgi:hypothetical protein
MRSCFLGGRAVLVVLATKRQAHILEGLEFEEIVKIKVNDCKILKLRRYLLVTQNNTNSVNSQKEKNETKR